MKRFHVHLKVQDLQASIAFYSKLFAAEPTRIESRSPWARPFAAFPVRRPEPVSVPIKAQGTCC